MKRKLQTSSVVHAPVFLMNLTITKFVKSLLLRKYDQFPTNCALTRIVLMMVLRWKGVPLVRGDLVATSFTTINARIRASNSRAVKVVEFIVIQLMEIVTVLVLSHASLH